MKILASLFLACVLLHADALSDIVGPVTAANTSPWPWYDKAEQGNITDVVGAALAHKPAVGAAAAGTFTLANACNITLTGAGASEFTAGDWVIIRWDAADGTGTGRMAMIVGTATSTVLTSSNQCGLPPNVPAASGLTVYHCTANCGQDTGSPVTFNPTWWGMFTQGDDWNYYDTGLAIYRYYLRTANSTYLTQFRDFTDTWWVWGVNQGGVALNPPRVTSLVSQFVRALDMGGSNGTARLAALYTSLKSAYDGGQNYTNTHPQDLSAIFDDRDTGYMMLFLGIGAMADSDPTRHAWYCSSLSTKMTTLLMYQESQGFWPDKSTDYPYRMPSASPWRSFAINQAVARAYDLFKTGSTLANPCTADATLSANLLTAATKAADYVYNYGRASNRGFYYDSVGPNVGLVFTEGTGTVSVATNSTAVVGVGTSFLTQFSGLPKYIGIRHTDGYAWTYLVTAVADNTHLTIATNFSDAGDGFGPSTNASGDAFRITDPAPTNCNGTTPTCFANLGNFGDGTVAGDRNNNREPLWIQGWIYKTTGNSVYKTRGDEIFSATYGGPALGPGDNYPGAPGPCGGPGCDGTETDYLEGIHACAVDPTKPCNPQSNYADGNPYHFRGKRFAQGSGIGGADNYLSWRLGAATTTTGTRISGAARVSGATRH